MSIVKKFSTLAVVLVGDTVDTKMSQVHIAWHCGNDVACEILRTRLKFADDCTIPERRSAGPAKLTDVAGRGPGRRRMTCLKAGRLPDGRSVARTCRYQFLVASSQSQSCDTGLNDS